MGSATGGVGTAAGLGFQYLATIGVLLDYLEANDRDFTLTTEHETTHTIDYAVSSDGCTLIAAQAKAAVDAGDGYRLGPTDVVDIAAGLASVDALEYRIDTNRPMAPTTEALLEWFATDPDVHREAPRWPAGLHASVKERLRDLGPTEFDRVKRIKVMSHHATNEELARTIADRILELRRRHLRGIGAESAQVLLGYLVAQILFLSGRRSGRHLTRGQALDLFNPTAHALAEALGRYDWGHFVGPFPLFERVARDASLDRLLKLLPGPPERGKPRLLALTGFSGAGKSTLAATFAEITAARYDHVVWLDSASLPAIEAAVQPLIPDATESTELASAFRDLIANSPETWLLIFDNATDSNLLDPWIAPEGHVDVVATSTVQHAWEHWRNEFVDAMVDEDALELVRVRLGLEKLSADEQIQAAMLVENLDHWPLAIELATAYLRRSGRGLTFTPEYLAKVRDRVIDDELFTPTGYRTHPTLLRAIHVALDDIAEADGGAGEGGWPAQHLLEMLTYLPARQAPTELAIQAMELVRRCGDDPGEALTECELPAAVGDWSIAADDALIRIASTSMIHFVQTPHLGRCARMNSIVAEVVRRKQGASTQNANLLAIQRVIHERLRQALDSEAYARALALAPSSEHVVGLGFSVRIVSIWALTILGNLASFEQRRGAFERALTLLWCELAWLDPREPSVLLAKVYGEMANSLVRLNRLPELLACLEAGVSTCERVLAENPASRSSLQVVADQIGQALQLLGPSGLADPTHLQEWSARLAPFDLHVDSLVTVGHLMKAGDTGRSLTVVDEALAMATSALHRLTLSFTKAEILTELGRLDEAKDLFDSTAKESRQLQLGLGPGWTPILNAWQYADRGLQHQSTTSEERSFGRSLDTLVGQDRPESTEDQHYLALRRAATSCELDDARTVSERLAALSSATFDTSVLVHDATEANLTATVCRKIGALRKRLGWPALLSFSGWAKGRLEGERIFTFHGFGGCLPEAVHESATPVPATWVRSDAGVGLLIAESTPLLIWCQFSSRGWLDGVRETELSEDRTDSFSRERTPALERLRDLIVAGEARDATVFLVPDNSGTVSDPRPIVCLAQGVLSLASD